jgi:hypothetical protein
MFNKRDSSSNSQWISVIFLQGEEADDLLSSIDRDGPADVFEFLQNWDLGDETTDAALENGYVYESIPAGSTDRVFEEDGSPFALAYNSSCGYVSLLRRYSEEPEVRVVATRRVLSAHSAQANPPIGPWSIDSGRPALPPARAVAL